MEAKKISFGFSKINKKPNLLPTKGTEKTDAKIELIKCLEGQEIKLVEEKPEEKPLIIPLKEAHKTSAAIASLIRRRAVLLDEEEPEDNNDKSVESDICTNNDGPEDIEKRAARELLAEIQMNGTADSVNNLILPVTKPDDLPLEGAKESTLDDYEDIPIQDFGKAMLRGMGWTEPVLEKNKKNGPPIDDTPMVRPKGMGLGADKALKKKKLLMAPEANEVLEIKRNAYVIILGGKHKDFYGTIVGFDDHAGRVIVQMAIGGAKEAFNEFLCQPVSRKEYAQYGKCINSSKYEEYKKKENEYGQIILDKEDKNVKSIKKERHDSVDDRHPKNNIEYETKPKKEVKEDKKYIKRESDHCREQRNSVNKEKERNRKADYDKNYGKSCSNKEDVESSKETNKHDSRNRRNEANRDEIKEHSRQYDGYRKQDYETTDYSRSQTFRKNELDDYNNRNRNDCGTSNRHRDEQSGHKRESYSERRTKDLVYSSDCESNSYAFKYKKGKKASLKKKSKKSKKYKNNSSDTDSLSSSADSSSDSEEEKYKRHKKKTKKSKRQRERSRSRGRR